MVQHSHGDSGKVLSEEWHKKRWEAETTTFGIEEWDEIDIARYDLEDVEFSRKFKRSTYEPEPRMEAEGSVKATDIKTLGDIRD